MKRVVRVPCCRGYLRGHPTMAAVGVILAATAVWLALVAAGREARGELIHQSELDVMAKREGQGWGAARSCTIPR